MIHWLAKNGWRLALVVGLTALTGLAVACGDDDDATSTPTNAGTSATATAAPAGPLKIGALMSYTGDLGTFGQPIFQGVELAVSEINASGGVNGQDIELITGDDGTVPAQAVTEAQRMVNIENVSAIIGALCSTCAIQVAETVTGPGKILQITPSGSSPAVTDAIDSDYLFRTTISDAAQGIVLSQLAQDEGLTSVCTLYVNNAYGKGLSNAFAAAFTASGGTVTAEVPNEPNQATYVSELGQCAGADALAAIAYPTSAQTFLREAVEGNMFENYLFVDGTKEPAMFTALGYASFDAQRGTAPSALPTASATTFAGAYAAKYGELPPKPFIKEAYDATYLIALAAEQADSNEGEAIHDALRDVSNAPGTEINPGPAGWKAALAAIEAGQEINYEGAGQLEMDDNGDPLVGAVEWWHVDAAAATLVRDKVFQVDLATKEVTDITAEIVTPAP